ncbi:hypothetical protein Esti_003276 [Eimeria stiedai]
MFSSAFVGVGPMSFPSEPRGLTDPFSENNQNMIRLLVEQAFISVSHGRELVNFLQAGSGLAFVLTRLHPIVPLPTTVWYTSAFQNFDQDQDGLINFKAFHQIIHKCHNHHCSALLLRSRQFAKDRPNVTCILRLKEKTLVSSLHCKLASHIMFPSHHGICQVYKDYKFGEVIGRGSFGKVQQVTQRKTNAERACKTIAIQSLEQWQLIKSEVELLKNLNHPNILKLFETYQDGYSVYLIIELCKGTPLFDRIVRHYEILRQPLTEEKVCRWMRQILSACSYCHEREVVHRDLKPENILFLNASEDSPLKVIDFGLSNTMSHLLGTARPVKTTAHRVGSLFTKLLPIFRRTTFLPWMGKKLRMERAGTPHYMAPEMIRGRYDEKCDLFAVGIIMYQARTFIPLSFQYFKLLTGRHPFYIPGRDDEESSRKKILFCDPSFTGERWRRISSEAKDLVKKLLQKNPKKRISAQASLAHAWFKVMNTRANCLQELTPSLFEGLRRWQSVAKLKQAVLYLIAKEYNESDILGLRRKFEALDIEGRGEITLAALKRSQEGFATRVVESELKKIFNSMDTYRRGHIGYNEFISAFLWRQGIVREAQLREVFDKFDRRREGRLTLDVLRGALKGTRCGSLSEEELLSFFREADRNNDGYLDFYEFCEMMTLGE